MRITADAAGPQLDDLVRHVRDHRETVVLTHRGHTALLVAPQVIADLENALADAQRQRREAKKARG